MLGHIKWFALAVWLVCLSTTAAAAPISFGYVTGGASGTLNGVAFDASRVTITAQGDTENRTSFENGHFVTHSNAQISIAGLGTFDFLQPTVSFVNHGLGITGFGLGPQAGLIDLLSGPQHERFDAWDMASRVPATYGAMLYRSWDRVTVETSGGVLSFFTDATVGGVGARLSLSAVVLADVPLPSGLVLMLAGIGALGVARRKRR